MKAARLTFFLLLLPLVMFSQVNPFSHKFWQPTYISGALNLGGHYRYQAGTTNEIYNYQKSSLLYGGIMLNSNSYFLHPNFLSVDIGLEYNPEIGKDLFLVVPDQADVRTMKKINASVTLFKQKPLTAGVFINYNDVYTNRENLSNIKSVSTNWGGNLTWSNKILPFQASYIQGNWKETEILTGRTFSNWQSTFQAKLSKSFSTRNNNELNYYHNDFIRQDANQVSTNNISDNLFMLNSIRFGKIRDHSFTSNISWLNQTGSDAFRRIQADENITLKLPLEFNLTGSYRYYNYYTAIQHLSQNTAGAMISHKLYQSLSSSVRFQYDGIVHSLYQENNLKAGIDLRYEKKIPTGMISLSYAYNWQRQMRVSEPLIVPIVMEDHLLSDGKITLLNKPYVEVASVVVKDATGTIIYQANFDYLLLERNNFIEIQRVPGGQIPNNTDVYIDYLSMQPGSYQYDVNFHVVNADIILFHRIVEVYFRFGTQNYSNLKTAEYLTLNFFNQKIYGCRLEYKFASGGAEYETYSSSIIPYRMIRYFAQLQGTFWNRLSLALNGNLRDYHMINEDNDQRYIDITGKIGYMFTSQTNLSFEAGYRKQVGQGIDLDLFTARGEFTTVFRQIMVKVGVEMYKRDYLQEHTSLMGGYVRIIRNFNWTKR